MTLWNNLKFFPKRSLRRKEKRFSIKKLNSKQPQSRWREGGSSTNLLLTLSNSGANYLLNSFESRQAMTNGSGHNGSHSQGGIPNGEGMIISKMVCGVRRYFGALYNTKGRIQLIIMESLSRLFSTFLKTICEINDPNRLLSLSVIYSS